MTHLLRTFLFTLTRGDRFRRCLGCKAHHEEFRVCVDEAKERRREKERKKTVLLTFALFNRRETSRLWRISQSQHDDGSKDEGDDAWCPQAPLKRRKGAKSSACEVLKKRMMMIRNSLYVHSNPTCGQPFQPESARRILRDCEQCSTCPVFQV